MVRNGRPQDMTVCCIASAALSADETLSTRASFTEEGTVGRALAIWARGERLFLLVNGYASFPAFEPASAFEVFEARCERYWEVRFDEELLIGPPPLARDPRFYELLVDGDESAEKLWSAVPLNQHKIEAMTVRCVTNDVSEMGPMYAEGIRGEARSLIPGQLYEVWGIHVTGGLTYYLIQGAQALYPVHEPATAFEIVESRVADDWEVSIADTDLIVGPPLMARNPNFCVDLAVGEPLARAAWDAYHLSRRLAAEYARRSPPNGY